MGVITKSSNINDPYTDSIEDVLEKLVFFFSCKNLSIANLQIYL